MKKIIKITTKSTQETLKLGEKIGLRCIGGEIIALTGELGAGKTHFVKGLAKGLGIEKDITSPTYVISQQYSDGRLPFIHCDLYRVSHFSELEEIGWYDFLSNVAVVAVEWADKSRDYIRDEKVLWVEIEIENEEQRIIKLSTDREDLFYLINF
jgi:tRNA threonylcarbamoyladenosine biosynthesis protein TsaE